MSHSSERRRALRAHVYHAPELAAVVPEHRRGRTDVTHAEAREGLRAPPAGTGHPSQRPAADPSGGACSGYHKPALAEIDTRKRLVCRHFARIDTRTNRGR